MVGSQVDNGKTIQTAKTRKGKRVRELRENPSRKKQERSSPGEGPKLESDIRISVGAEYRHGLRAAESSIVKSIPCHTK
ncbi:hypothetical protein TNCV_2457511 [Trichonephila clavipes]|nr:hypothetical protein TNCV_2457511 [Trichonephila clavipes]